MKFLEGLNWVCVLGIVVAVETQIGNGSMSLVNMVPEGWIPFVKAWMANLGSIGALIMSAGVFGKPMSSTSMPVPPSVKAVVVLGILIGATFAFADHASAQGALKKTAAAAPSKCLLIFDPLKLCGVLTGNLQDDVQRVAKRIAAVSKSDLNYAMAKARAAGTPASKIRLQCIQAISDANDQAIGASLKNLDGTDMVRPDPAFVTGIEDVAELVDNLSPQGVLLTSCAGAAKMLGMNALAAVNAIVTGTASFALLPAGL